VKEEPAGHNQGHVPLRDFPGIPLEYAEVLKSRGILHSGELLQALRHRDALGPLARATGIPSRRLEELRALCDLARVQGTTPAVVRELYRAGIRSAGELAREDPVSLGQKLRFMDSVGWKERTDEALLATWIRNAAVLAEGDPENDRMPG
jgi:hypothetical protein